MQGRRELRPLNRRPSEAAVAEVVVADGAGAEEEEPPFPR